MSEYLERITGVLNEIENTQSAAIKQVAEKVAETIENDGLIYVFGCGHSHIPALDTFYRAGGLANVSAMLDTDLMLHNGAAKSSRMEKMKGIGAEIFRRYKVEKRDMLFVFSLSGKNEVPCEVADSARAAGVFTVGVSSSAYFEKGGKLHDHVDLHIDCRVPYGDACINICGENGENDAKMGGLSTAAFCFILNSALIEGAKIAASRGVKVPVYLSGNVDGGREHNIVLEDKYLGRVKHL